jgi:uncharacterized protein (TIGR03437 family)
MRHSVAIRLTLALLPAVVLAATQQITLAPEGPFRVAGPRILDARGRVFVMRGTTLRAFHPETAAYDAQSTGDEYGPHSATSLAAIRLRFNMNTVRLPLRAADASRRDYFAELSALVRRANGVELLVIVSARDGAEDFWTRCAEAFRAFPNVMFEAPARAISAIRAADATQPVVLSEAVRSGDPNVIYTTEMAAAPHLESWDVNPNDPAACRNIPADPQAVAKSVRDKLDSFDRGEVSWLVSEFEPGRLIKDFYGHDASTFENGWTCGQPSAKTGLGRVVQAHMRATAERGLFVVGIAGGVDVPRGGYAVAYGPVLAERDGTSLAMPLRLGGVRVEITDTLGVTRPAGIYFTTAGWGQINFVIPAASALGPARMTLTRADGSVSSTNITIAETAPGFWTGVSCRGPALGSAKVKAAGGTIRELPISACKNQSCSTLAVPVHGGTSVRIVGSGLRHAPSAGAIEATLDGVRVPVVSFGPAGAPGIDQLTIKLPPTLRSGEADLICRIDGRISNPVRIRLSAN